MRAVGLCICAAGVKGFQTTGLGAVHSACQSRARAESRALGSLGIMASARHCPGQIIVLLRVTVSLVSKAGSNFPSWFFLNVNKDLKSVKKRAGSQHLLIAWCILGLLHTLVNPHSCPRGLLSQVPPCLEHRNAE